MELVDLYNSEKQLTGIVSAGGFAKAGENSEEAVMRETNEELGIRIADQSKLRFLFTAPISYVFDDFYLYRADISLADLKLLDSEICEAKWADKAEIISMINGGRFVDYDVEIIKMVFMTEA